MKLYDCLVCETGEVRSFYYLSDANRFVFEQTQLGNHVIRGVSYAAC